MASIAIISLLLIGGCLTAAFALWLGARWTGDRRSYWRAVCGVVLCGIALAGMNLGAARLRQPLYEFLIENSKFSLYPVDTWVLFAGQIILGAFLVWMIVKWMLRVPFTSAIIASLPVLLLGFLAGAGHPLVIKPYIVEPLELHSGSMCPTLLGSSQTANCPECGAVAYTPWVTEQMPGDEDGRFCTCSACCHSARSQEISPLIVAPDQFVVNKLLSPRRWDLVLYRAPHVRSFDGGPIRIRFVKRIIGLPGEEVVLKDGAVWINGERQTPPEEIAGLRFLDKFEDRFPILWGSTQKPAKLGDREYFVVGDYGYHSNDSRTWNHRLEGHAPYGLPSTHIVGVVDLRYGPLSRWLIFR